MKPGTAARMLGIDQRKVRRMVEVGLLPAMIEMRNRKYRSWEIPSDWVRFQRDRQANSERISSALAKIIFDDRHVGLEEAYDMLIETAHLAFRLTVLEGRDPLNDRFYQTILRAVGAWLDKIQPGVPS
jgi:hypothetical protein